MSLNDVVAIGLEVDCGADFDAIHARLAAAGHEVRPWLAQVGSHGLLHLIQLMNEGADFEAAYDLALEKRIPC